MGGDHNAVEDKYMDTLNVNPVYINDLLEGAHQIKTFKSNLGMEYPYRHQMGQIKGPDYTYIRQLMFNSYAVRCSTTNLLIVLCKYEKGGFKPKYCD